MRIPQMDTRIFIFICLATLFLHWILFWERSVLSLQTKAQNLQDARALQAIQPRIDDGGLSRALHDISVIAGNTSKDTANVYELSQALERIKVLADEAAAEVAIRNGGFEGGRGRLGTNSETTPDEKLIRLVEQLKSGTDLNLDPSRRKIRLLVGVFTGFNDPGRKENRADVDRYDYKKRRKALRDTWFPGTMEEKKRLEDKGIIVKFIVGHTDSVEEELKMKEEEVQHKDIMRLPITEGYYGLTNKTKTFFSTAAMMYDADWVVKVDDDVYLMVERILLAAEQWDKMGAGYIGCMKHGYVWKEEKSRWFEPHHLLLGQEYYLHAYGSIYVLSKNTVQDVILRNFNNLRYLSNEDTTVGSWMLGHNVTHFEDMRLCATRCSDAAVGILKNECAGLCNPLKDMYLVHNAQSCKNRLNGSLEYLPSYPDHTDFEAMRV